MRRREEKESNKNSSKAGWLAAGLAMGAAAALLFKEFFKEKETPKQEEEKIQTTPTTEPKFYSETAEEFYGLICPITQEIMQDPVVTPEGLSYERWAILEWI